MSDSKSKYFLKQIFWQSYADENFYQIVKKLGVNFSSWPDTNEYLICKNFEKLALEKNHAVAVFQLDLEIPEDVFKSILTEEEIKIFYSEHLLKVLALDLANKIKSNPENTSELCEEFLNKKVSTASFFSITESVEKFVLENEEKIKNDSQKVIIKGFEILSETISGFNVGRVTIITAHSGFGKSNLALNILKNAMKSGLRSIFINMEMELFDITKRFLQSEYSMRQSEFERSEYISKITKNTDSWMLYGQNTYFTNGSSLSLSEIQSLVIEVKRKQGIDLVFVDYDQKVLSDVDDDSEEWKFIQKTVERLEAIAKREKVHVILFSQTDEDKGGMPRASKRAIQPASSVIYFHKDQNENIIFDFIKNRFGPTNIKILVHYDPTTSFIVEDKVLDQSIPQKTSTGFKRRTDVFG